MSGFSLVSFLTNNYGTVFVWQETVIGILYVCVGTGTSVFKFKAQKTNVCVL